MILEVTFASAAIVIVVLGILKAVSKKNRKEYRYVLLQTNNGPSLEGDVYAHYAV